jgi:hypothetical protein
MATKTVKYLTRDQVFNISLSGLMPLTVHYVYFENNLVAASNIKPLGGVLGDPVKTDRNGQVSFDYYHNGGTLLDTTPFEQAQALAIKLANPKQITVANKSTAILDADYQTTYLSYASTTIKVSTTTEPKTVAVAPIFPSLDAGLMSEYGPWAPHRGRG